MTEPARRPTALTLACLVLAAVGVTMTISLTSVLGDWGSLELQEAVESALESDVGIDMSVDTALSWLRVVCFVLLVATIALTVLAIWAMRGDRASRWALTVLCGIGAVLMGLAGPVTLLPAMAMVGSIVVLWSAESRVWFDVTNGRTPSPALVARATRKPLAPLPPMYPGASAHGLDRWSTGEPVPPPRPGEVPPPAAYPPYGAYPPYPHRPVRAPLPGVVTAAAIVMLVGSLLAGGVVAVNALMYVAREVDPELVRSPDGSTRLLVESMYGIERSDSATWITVGISTALAVLAGVACLVSIGLLLKRRSLVRPAVWLSYVTVVLGAVALPLGLVVSAAAVATVVLLSRPDVRQWRRTPEPPRM